MTTHSLPAGTSADPATRPCGYCGRPVAQRDSAGRPFRYCRDNDGACQRAARNGRMRERNSPGLTGQLARTWELVERLELTANTLADALHGELTAAGVERQVAAVRAEAAGQVAAAHTARDEARREAEESRARAAAHADDAGRLATRTEELESALDQARTQLRAARTATAEAVAGRDEARAQATREAALHAEVRADLDQARSAVDQLQEELSSVRVEHGKDRDRLTGVRAELDQAREAAVRDAATRDRLATQLAELGTEWDTLAGQVREAELASAELRHAHERAGWERDAANAQLTRTGEELREERAARSELVAVQAELQESVTTARAELAALRQHNAALTAQVTQLTEALARTVPIPAQPDRPAGEQLTER
jgi:chromosome segregation ATPase